MRSVLRVVARLSLEVGVVMLVSSGGAEAS